MELIRERYERDLRKRSDINGDGEGGDNKEIDIIIRQEE